MPTRKLRRDACLLALAVLLQVEAFLLEQPEIAGQGVRWWRQWWRPYVSMLQAYCRGEARRPFC